MTNATKPTPSSQYFTPQVRQTFHNVKGRVNSTLDKLRKTFSYLGNAALSVSYGLRQEVPFERWFYDYGFQVPLDKTEDLIKARFFCSHRHLRGAHPHYCRSCLLCLFPRF